MTVIISSSKTVSPALIRRSSAVLRGRCGQYASVQFTGYVCLPIRNGPRWVTSLVSNGSGGKSGTGRQVVVLEVDTAAKTCGFIA